MRAKEIYRLTSIQFKSRFVISNRGFIFLQIGISSVSCQLGFIEKLRHYIVNRPGVAGAVL